MSSSSCSGKQVANVFEGVVDLGVGERAAAPVGPLFALGRGAVEELADDAAVGRGEFRAAEAGGELGVEQVGRRAAAVVRAKFTSSRAAWTIVVCLPSASVRQNSLRLPARYGSITARRSFVATWIRQSSGRKVSSETNSVSKPMRSARASSSQKSGELGRRSDGGVRHGAGGHAPGDKVRM